MFLPHPRVKVNIVGSLGDREVACSASDHQGSNFESCVWRTVSSHSSHHPQEVLLAQFSLYVHKGGLKPDSFHFIILGNVRISRNFARDNAVLDNGVYGWDDKSAFVNTGNWPNVLPEFSHHVPKLMYQQQPVVGGGGLLRVGWRELVGGLEL